jgi:hypothetical protein
MRLWQSFWFPLVPVRRLAAFRIAVVAFALISILSSGYMLRYARVDQSFYHPLLVLRVLRLPQPGVGVMTALYVLLIVALVCALIGLAGLRRSRDCMVLRGCAVCRGIAQPTGAAGMDATWQTCWVASSWW